jgi:hypothetical protein
MRKKLEANEGLRGKFTAKFVRTGSKTGYNGYAEETILLKEVRESDTNKIVADHLWFSYTKGFQSVTLTTGVTLEFEARIKKYSKGYVNKQYGINQRQHDYKLSHPTRIKVINDNANPLR